MVAMTFAACSNDDDVVTNPEPQPGEKGALVEGLSINFGESTGGKTRAYSGTQKGQGTEGMIYEAFIFAKEANPTHASALDGDWTVIRVTADQAGSGLVTETGGVDVENTPKASLTKAINQNSTAETEWLVQNVATFKGVRQGDYVYVIANDPNLTLAQATVLAHNGEESEDDIKAYVASINKDYLNGLTFAANATGAKPAGKYFMAGREIIPVSPNIPSNGDFSMTIGLDRELAKVNFNASITTSDVDAAYGKVAFQEGDGIVVARIARKASPFAEQIPDWYVPANTCVEDWPINNHAKVDGAYTAFCDGTREGSFVFDGISATPITNWIAGTTIPANFNATAPAADVTEYRYSWKLKSGEELTAKTNLVYLSNDKGTIYAPTFYTTPNYSNNTNSVTVICTQATYVARGVFANSDMKDEYINAALAESATDIEVFTATETTSAALTFPNPLKKTTTDGTNVSDDDITAKVKAVIEKYGISIVDEDSYSTVEGLDYAGYLKVMDRFYVAVLLQQRLADKGTGTSGTQTDQNQADTWGNGIPQGKTGYYLNAETDSLMCGYKKFGEVKKNFAFYLEPTMNEEAVKKMFCKVIYKPASVEGDEMSAANIRAAYFANLDNYEYFKGQKLYYRADVANYIGGVSNRITERNMYYTTRGTIQTLGAKNIHDAIYTDQNTMHIDVTVNDWLLSINNVPM